MQPLESSRTEVGTTAPVHTIGPYVSQVRIAYFSMEIALRDELHTYSGGLGVLAGDTARACADMDLPTIFVTLISRQGYLHQEIDESGRQVEHPDPWPCERWLTPLRAKVAVVIEEREVWVRPWLYVLEGTNRNRVPVLLLDTDLDENDPRDRGITDHLYGGDQAYRFRQEVVLGIGGVRALQALGFTISVYHMNEGHAAFLALDLLRRYPRPVDQVAPGELAWDVGRVRAQCVFTTHTPVEAGHDRFGYAMYDHLLAGYFPSDSLRRIAGEHELNMTRLALNLSGYVNGVATRHAETTARMFPGYRIRAVTNGVHTPTWAHPAFAELFSEHEPSWAYEPETFLRFDELLPDADVWRAHEIAKRELVEQVRDRTGVELDARLPILGFARRITAYKRPGLLFEDIERMLEIHAEHPFQIVMAGKSHPADGPGRRLIQHIHETMRAIAPNLRAVFLPNYGMRQARGIVAGVDVWLNTPEPPLEASGTSGMKAAINGVLNLSTLDGWWLKGCIEGVTGWSIPGAPVPTADDLYDRLERDVLPLYFDDRGRWIFMMKQSIAKIGAYFNTHRMMRRYATEAYLARRPSLQVAPAAPARGT
jgi:glycogen phosphorylase